MSEIDLKLCDDMVPLSFKSISEINFTKLNSISFRLIGSYGNHTLISKLLLIKKIINKKMCVILNSINFFYFSLAVIIEYTLFNLDMTCLLPHNLPWTNLHYVLVFTCCWLIQIWV